MRARKTPGAGFAQDIAAAPKHLSRPRPDGSTLWAPLGQLPPRGLGVCLHCCGSSCAWEPYGWNAFQLSVDLD